jgi:hypothetical protein
MNLNTNNKNLMSQDSGVSGVSGVLNPWFLTGFTDAEACYRVSIIKNKNYKSGPAKDTSGGRLTTLPLSVRLYFQIGLHRKDEDLLRLIQSELGVGKIYRSRSDSSELQVSSVPFFFFFFSFVTFTYMSDIYISLFFLHIKIYKILNM